MLRLLKRAFQTTFAVALVAAASASAASAAVALVAAASASVASAATLSPLPGTPDASPATQISVLGAQPGDIHVLEVRGSRSGRHPGRLRAYSSAAGASFVPKRRFVAGERVTVRLRIRARKVSYSFTIGHPTTIGSASGATVHASATTQSFVSRPDLHPPAVDIRTAAGGAPGDIFLTPMTQKSGGLVGQFGPLILDARGGLVWTQPMTTQIAANLRPQTYLGTPVLTWWQGRVATPAGVHTGKDEIVDSSYRSVAHVRAGNGYLADPHDFVLNGGAALLLSYVPVRMDLSRLGGSRNGAAFDAVVQEIDVRTGLVMLEWHALGHVPLTDSHIRVSRGGPIADPYHVNSVDVGHGGNLLVSMRNTWAVYYVSARSGRILWQLGGRHSNFRFARGARFAWQHDARLLGGGRLSVFDNEASPRVGPQSRGIVLRLNRHRATLVHAYAHSPRVVAHHEGDVEVLPGGATFIGWGQSPYFSEFAADGRLVLDGRLPGADETYRAFLFPWSAQPARPPDVAVRRTGGAATVYASWNGATAVASWQVLSGSSPSSLAPVASAARAGFETAIAAPGGPYFAVRALDASGRVLGTSSTVSG
jgi:hypothetical protein